MAPSQIAGSGSAGAVPRLHPNPLATLTYRGLVALLGGLAVTAQAAHLDDLTRTALGAAGGGAGGPVPGVIAVSVMDGLLTGLFAALALVLAFGRDAGRGARPLALALAVWSYLLAYTGVVSLLRPPDPTSVPRTLFEGHLLVVEMTGLAALVRFTAVFPGGSAEAARATGPSAPHSVSWATRLGAGLRGRRVPWVCALLVAAGALALNNLLDRPPQDAPLLALVDVVRFVAIAVVVTNLQRAHLDASAAGRRRLHWIVVGFTLLVGAVGVVIGGNVLTAVTGWTVPVVPWRPAALHAGVAALVWGVAMGVLYDGVRAPEPLARHALGGSAAALLALLLGAGLEALLSGSLFAGVALPAGAGTSVAIAAVAVAYARFREPFDSWLRRA